MGNPMPRCRTCPRCGGRKWRDVGRNFRPGTWRQCLICGAQFRPPVSLLTAGAALLFGASALAGAVLFVTVGVDPLLTGIMAVMGAGFALWGAGMIVRYAKTPVGPLAGFELDSAAPD